MNLARKGFDIAAHIPSYTTRGWRKLWAYRLGETIDANGPEIGLPQDLSHVGDKGLSGFQTITEARLQEPSVRASTGRMELQIQRRPRVGCTKLIKEPSNELSTIMS